MTMSPVPHMTADHVPASAARQAELRSYLQIRRLVGRTPAQPARERGQSVVLVPGFISGDVSLSALARRLRGAGHRTFRSEIGANLGCTDVMVERLIRRVESVSAAEGRPVVLIGHSRGGMIVKLGAQRRPELVAGVVALAAPVTGTLSVAPHVRRQLEMLFTLNARGVGKVIGADCVTGACGQRVADELQAPFPSGVPYVSIYTPTDAIIDWRTCLDPAADVIEVTGATHTGMGTHPAVAAVVVDRLGRIPVAR